MIQEQVFENEVAIIGIAGRFPGAKSVEDLWVRICNGEELIRFFSEEELRSSGVPESVIDDPSYVRASGVVEDFDMFDANFFGYSPREAELMDPQLRLFLECAKSALDSAGYAPEVFEGLIGVYAGAAESDYGYRAIHNEEITKTQGDLNVVFASSRNTLATRVSYKLDLRGPSIYVQTACSTSLVAVHLACQALLCGECDIALAGGISIQLFNTGYLYTSEIMSPDGHCRAFDAKGQGFVPGDGVGIVVLKRLSEALRDQDTIIAVIKGSAINNDGHEKVSYTAPSVNGQAQVIKEALTIASVEAETISYVETHGTATPLGDPIEVAALTQAFRSSTSLKNFCAIGSIKTNIGHLDAAAGIAGLIKTSMALKNKQIPPSLHFCEPNPEIDFPNSPFYVNTSLSLWKRGETPRRASVSSFGLGGTNAHVILEETTQEISTSRSRSWQLLVISAKNSSALERATYNLTEYLNKSDQDLADIAYTLQVGRSNYSYRRIVLCRSMAEGIRILETRDPLFTFSAFHEMKARPIFFMFPGGGSQRVNMGSELYRSEPTFRDVIDKCAYFLKKHLDMDLRDVLYPSEQHKDEMVQLLRKVSIALPVLFTTEYALACLWIEWVGHPQAMIGQSLGEYVAACLAGVLSLEDALALVSFRGQLFNKLPVGAMLTVPLGESSLQEHLEDNISIAAINAADLCSVAGTVEAIEKLELTLAAHEVSSQRLYIDAAGHSSIVDPVLDEFREFVASLKLKAPNIPYISNVTGTWITEEEATDPVYWMNHLRQTVRFHQGLSTLLSEGIAALVEVGPGHMLTTLVQQHVQKTPQHIALPSLERLNDQRTDDPLPIMSLGQLWLSGVAVDWFEFYRHERRQRIPLPTYPFEHQRFWIKNHQPDLQTRIASTSIKKVDIADWFYAPIWKQAIISTIHNFSQLLEQEACWLVFCDPSGVGIYLANFLKQSQQNVVTIEMGESFVKNGENAYSIDPLYEQGYDFLLEEVKTSNLNPTRVIYLWSISLATFHLAEVYTSLFSLTRGMDKARLASSISMSIITNGIQSFAEESAIYLENASLLGLGKLISHEYPAISCRTIDIDRSESGAWRGKKIAEYIFSEMTINPGDLSVSYHGNQRWIQIVDPIHLDINARHFSPLREKGVYVITEGLTDIGLSLATYLAKNFHARLILVGNYSFQEKANWAQGLTASGRNEEHDEIFRKIQSIEMYAAEILTLKVESYYDKEFRDLIEETYSQFGKIDGLIHAIDVPALAASDDKRKSGETLHDYYVHQILTRLLSLENALKDIPLEFCFLYPSALSLKGTADCIDILCSMESISAFITRHNALFVTPWLYVNWDKWSFEENRLSTKLEENDMLFALSSPEGTEVFHRVLSILSAGYVIVSSGDLTTRIERSTKSISANADIPQSIAQNLHMRPELQNSYIAPQSEREYILAQLWQDLLGIEQIGIYDNFFELGGSSLIALQLIARAKIQGLNLTSKQVLQNQTIADLAKVADNRYEEKYISEKKAEVVAGPIYLTPIQKWFFEQEFPERNYWNGSFLLETQQMVVPQILGQVVECLLSHHDILRARFFFQDSEWKQECLHPDAISIANIYSSLDLSGLSQVEQKKALEESISKAHRSLNLLNGPIMRVLLFNMGSNTANYILVIIHHLMIDGFSNRILVEDLEMAYNQLLSNKTLQLPSKTTSFQEWASYLKKYTHIEQLDRELDYWLMASRSHIKPLPVDYPGSHDTIETSRYIEEIFTIEETSALLHNIPLSYHVSINDVLITALIHALQIWTQLRYHLIELVNHGRGDAFDNIDISRTVGWFMTSFPVLFYQEGIIQAYHTREELIESLRMTKKQFDGIPNQGIGYGILRYMSDDPEVVRQLQEQPQPEVGFNYQGQFEDMSGKSSIFTFAKASAGENRSERTPLEFKITVVAIIIHKKLHVRFDYGGNSYRDSTIAALSQNFARFVREVVSKGKVENAE